MTRSTGYFLLCVLFAGLFAWVEATPPSNLALKEPRRSVSLTELAASTQPLMLGDTDSSVADDLRFDLAFRFQFQPEMGDTLLFGTDAFEQGFNLILRPPAIPILAIKNGYRSATLIEFSELKPWETYNLRITGDRTRFAVDWNGSSTNFTANLRELPGLHHIFVAGFTEAVPRSRSRGLDFQLSVAVPEESWLSARVWSWFDKLLFAFCLIAGALFWCSLQSTADQSVVDEK